MKRTAELLTLVVAICFMLTACGNNYIELKKESVQTSNENTSIASGESTKSLGVKTPDSDQAEPSSSNKNQETAPANESGTGKLPFGATLNEMKKQLGIENMVNTGGGVYIFVNKLNGATYYAVNGVFNQINYSDFGSKTSKGLCVGDGYNKMVAFYGKNYATYTEEGTTYYVYSYPNAKFSVCFGEGTDEIYQMNVFANPYK